MPIFKEMKTTLELPDQLYSEVKTRAASQKRTVKDLVSEGLQILLAANAGSQPSEKETIRQVLMALDEIQRCPPSPSNRTAFLQEAARKSRNEGWNREDA